MVAAVTRLGQSVLYIGLYSGGIQCRQSEGSLYVIAKWSQDRAVQ